MKPEAFDELIASVREGGQILKGKAKPSRVFAAPDGLAHEAASLPLARERMTGIEAAAKIAYHLTLGEVMTQGLVAAMTGWDRINAGHLLDRMSRVMPIYS